MMRNWLWLVTSFALGACAGPAPTPPGTRGVGRDAGTLDTSSAPSAPSASSSGTGTAGARAPSVATFVVVVQDAAGAPLRGVGLRVLAGPGEPERVTSDERGEARFGAGAGVLQIIVDDPRRPAVMTYAELAAGETKRQVVVLPEAALVDGAVLDAAGQPLADAEIEILPVGMVVPPRTTTDAAGHFRAVLAEGSWRIKVSKAQKSALWTTLDIAKGQTAATATIRMVEAASLVVTSDCPNKGCPGAEATVSVANSSWSKYLDAAGGVTFTDLPIGDAVVTVRDQKDPRHPRLGEVKLTLVTGAAASARVQVAVLDARATVTGKLVERSGKPAAQVAGTALVVEAFFQGFGRRVVVAAADGSFVVDHVLPGEVQLSGLRIDPTDPMSGANGGRSTTKATAPAKAVVVQINDFTGRGP
ncbi:MAG: carboxypeptidase regulatory-like domain-containing protein [Myxococcales bacterium]|nr:carboxypeptidase regulatory-like domain-containing protein [Myxococcales bacterium]